MANPKEADVGVSVHLHDLKRLRDVNGDAEKYYNDRLQGYKP